MSGSNTGENGLHFRFDHQTSTELTETSNLGRLLSSPFAGVREGLETRRDVHKSLQFDSCHVEISVWIQAQAGFSIPICLSACLHEAMSRFVKTICRAIA